MPITRGPIAILAFMLASMSGGACAMTQSNSPERCRVIGEELLPAEIGGGRGLCDALESAVASRAPGVGFTAEIEVRSNSSLHADIKLSDGRSLPRQKLSVSDRKLNKSSIGRFAIAVAEVISQARN